MSRPRTHADNAAKQAAYRDRRKAQSVPTAPAPASTPAVQYRRWRTAVASAYALLETVYEELGDWMQERSERWQESERAGELEADKDRLYEILDALDELAVLGRR